MKSVAHLFTSITANYLPKARVLAESARRQKLDIQFHVLLCDDYPREARINTEPFDSIINVADLPILNRDAWLFGHNLVEMCTAVKPLGFLEIANRFEAAHIFYFDPDMLILSGLDNLLKSLEKHSVLLTPHLTVPECSIEAVKDNEIAALKHGIYNLGFLGVRTSKEGLRFLAWWADRLQNFCHIDIPSGLFTDQRWIDLVPAFFDDIFILRDSIYNVATWNLNHRPVAGTLKHGLSINGDALSFFHFSGLDSGAQELMLKKYAGSNHALHDLRNWYISECEIKGQSILGQLPCCYAVFDNGETIKHEYRLLYRTRLDLQQAFPHPFKTGKNTFHQWLQQNPTEVDALSTYGYESLLNQLREARRELHLLHGSRSWKLLRLISRLRHAFK